MSSSQQPPSDDNATGTAPNQTTYSDASGRIFNFYATCAEKMDQENVENWKDGADTILVFIGLFSSTVATFIAISYPSLQQDPNVVTQSLLAQISQQLSSANANGSISAANPSTQNPFSPSASVVFVNSVWFLSLVLSLTCALMATLLRQWARRYLQIVRQNHQAHIRAHIREYFYQGARRFGLFGLAELLPSLLIISVLLFFAGLVVFAFLGNHTVAKFTLAIVGFCFLSYIIFTLMPLVFHDCPYWTPLTTVLWFASQKIRLAFYWVRDCGATYLLSKGRVKLYRETHEKKAKLWSEDMVSQLQDSAKRTSMEIYTKTLVWTIDQLDKDHDIEEFFAGIPDLYGSVFFISLDSSIRVPLAWSILWFALDAVEFDLSKYSRQKRLKTCFKALYYIPGAVHDLLAVHIPDGAPLFWLLPLLDTPESLEIIDDLQDLDELNDDVALSARCVAAVVAAFMITPPRRALEDPALTRYFSFIGDDNTGKQFLAKRLRVGPTADGDVSPEIHPNSDSARLQNIVRFLADLKDTPQYEDITWRSCDNSDSIRRERQKLFDQRQELIDQRQKPLHQRHTEESLQGLFPIIIPRGDRASPDFVPAVQQDLIILTLEILARDPVANAATAQREAFYGAYMELEEEMAIQALLEPLTRTLTPENRDPESQVSPQSLEVLEPEARVHSPDFIQMIRRALEPVFQALSALQNAPYDDHVPSLQMPMPGNDTPYDDHTPSLQMPVPGSDTPYDDHASSLPMPVPQIATSPSTVSYVFPSSPAGPSTAVGG
ncbi:hypothetical protein V8E53_011622 [Lactarius tabidus]